MSDAIDRAARIITANWRDHTPLTLAQALDAAGLLEQDLEVHIEDHSLTGQPSTCVVQHHGVTVFDGVSREAPLPIATWGISEQEAQERESAAAVKALREAADDIDLTMAYERDGSECANAESAAEAWLRLEADRLAQQGHEQEGRR